MRRTKSLLAIAIISALFAGCTKGGGGGDGGGASDSGQFAGDCALRVANGEQCSPAKGPITLIYLQRAGTPIAICTGTFLTPNQVLTAAHCFVESGADSALVSQDGEESQSAHFAVHPSYHDSSEPSPYDVAVITLKNSLNVATLPLLIGQGPKQGDTINIIGYGLDENGHSAGDEDPSKALHKGVMTYQDTERNLLVATPGDGGQTVCPGDSGSPGIMLNHDGLPGVVGVTNSIGGRNFSSLDSCQGVDVAVFTSIQFGAVRDWITQQVPNAGAI